MASEQVFTPRPAQPAGRRDRARRRPGAGAVTAVLAITGTLVSLQQTLLIPVLPELPDLLHTSRENASWAITATLLTASIATPIISRLADMFGKRRMMLVDMVLMTLGSVIGALSTSLWQLILARALQGFAMSLIPVGISVMRDELPREKVAGAAALMSATLGIGSAVGLPLAGFIASHGDWHHLFWVSAAGSVLMMVAVLLVVPESPIRTPGRFDLVGALLFSAFLLCLLLPITNGSTWGWTNERTLALLLAAAALLAAWVPWELRASAPMVDLRTSARRPVLLTNIAALLLGFAFYGNMLSTTQMLEMPRATGYGFALTLLQAGLCMLPSGLAMVVMSPVSARIIERWGPRAALISGALVLASGYVLRVFLTSSLTHVVIGATIVSAGLAITYAAMPLLIMRSVPITETASANGFNALLRSVGTATSSAVVAALLTASVMHVGGRSLPTLDAFKHIFWLECAAALVAATVAAFIPTRLAKPVVPEAGAGGGERARELVVRGRVLSGGTAVRHAVVTLLTTSGEQVDWARAEPDGSYSVVLPGPGRYLRLTSADGWEPRSEVVEVSGAQQESIDLGERLHLGGTVTLAGRPVPGALVALVGLGGERIASTHTDGAGHYRLPLPVHGRHVLTALDGATGATASAHITAIGVARTHDLQLQETPR